MKDTTSVEEGRNQLSVPGVIDGRDSGPNGLGMTAVAAG
jgi:hypothetical protein